MVDAEPHEFFREIQTRLTPFHGTHRHIHVDSEVGTSANRAIIERAGKTSRIVDVKYVSYFHPSGMSTHLLMTFSGGHCSIPPVVLKCIDALTDSSLQTMLSLFCC